MITSSLNTAFTYMNLIEHWGSGIPRIIDKVKAAGLQEPEFIGGEVDLRINIYRGQADTNNAMINANDTENGANGIKCGADDGTNSAEVPDTIDRMPDSGNEVPDTTEKMPDSEQKRTILKIKLIKMEKLISQVLQCII